jgi:hypothetical protein
LAHGKELTILVGLEEKMGCPTSGYQMMNIMALAAGLL